MDGTGVITNIPAHQIVDIQYIDFTLMLVGASGQGKTSFMSSFFGVDYDNGDNGKIVPQTTTVNTREWTMKTQAPGINLRLHVIDTPGYGDDPNVFQSFSAILKHIDLLNKQYQSDIHKDRRVNLVLYFLPTPRVKACDLIFSSLLSKVALVIPIISKADTLRAVPKQQNELSDYKRFVQDQLKQMTQLTGQQVYAVVNARKGKSRDYGWGCVDPWGANADMFDNIALSDYIAENFRDIRSQVGKYYTAWERDGIPSVDQMSSPRVQFFLVGIVCLVIVFLAIVIKR